MSNRLPLLRRLLANKMTLTFALLALVIMLFVFVPLAKTIFSSSPATLFDTLLDAQVRGAIWLSIYTALLATLVGAVFGVPLAYILARFDFP
ncbi:MAG: hypothetical protein D4R82_00630, partial [Dehalococcoidia bacterium]